MGFDASKDITKGRAYFFIKPVAHKTVQEFAPRVFNRQTVFFAKTPPAHFNGPIKDVACEGAFLCKLFGEFRINPLVDSRHRHHYGGLDVVQIVNDLQDVAVKVDLIAHAHR